MIERKILSSYYIRTPDHRMIDQNEINIRIDEILVLIDERAFDRYMKISNLDLTNTYFPKFIKSEYQFPGIAQRGVCHDHISIYQI